MSETARWLVLSPHCDDGVLSLGASLAAHVRGGGAATVVTLLAGDPASDAPAGPWDAAAGFRTAGEAARARRREDQAACGVLGVHAFHLPGQDEQYGPVPNEADLWAEVVMLAARHDVVFVPGFPLKHGDHRRIAHDAAACLVAAREVRRYGEEPYLLLSRRTVSVSPAPDIEPVEWRRVPASVADRTRKIRAVRRYRSQLPLLAGLAGASARPGRAVTLLARLWADAARGEWLTESIGGTGQ